MGGSPKNRVVIIGGGPAGLACLRVFAESGERWELTLFEAREELGGVWYRGDDRRDPGLGHGDDERRPLPPSAIYDSLTTNIPHTIMAYNDHPFPPETALYPPASTVQRYLLSYADHFSLRQHVRLGRRVDRAEWDGAQWRVRVSKSVASASDIKPDMYEVTCDYLLVANGHYSKPYHPIIPGLEHWEKPSSDRHVSHSMWYREPSGYAGKKVLVIGGGPSGTDISTELAFVADETYHSVRGFMRDDTSKPRKRPGPVSFDPQSGTVIYADGSRDLGMEEIILATGYEFSFPMMTQVTERSPPKGKLFPGHVYNSRWNVYPLAKHLFPMQNDFPSTSVAFIGLPSRVIPFPLMECQAAVARHIFKHPESFDVEAEKEQIEERRRFLEEAKGGDEGNIAKEWHRLPEKIQFDYRRELLGYAGLAKWAVKPWHEDAYMNKGVLRQEWRDLERLGEADKWVKGVDSEEKWIELQTRLLKRAQDRERASRATHAV